MEGHNYFSLGLKEGVKKALFRFWDGIRVLSNRERSGLTLLTAKSSEDLEPGSRVRGEGSRWEIAKRRHQE